MHPDSNNEKPDLITRQSTTIQQVRSIELKAIILVCSFFALDSMGAPKYLMSFMSVFTLFGTFVIACTNVYFLYMLVKYPEVMDKSGMLPYKSLHILSILFCIAVGTIVISWV